jgi:hypothetical protein
MKIENLTDDQKYKCFIEFKTRCYFFYRTYRINKILFEENMEAYNELDSPKFINNALVDHLLLQLHLITDSATFGKTEDKNLSVFFFLEWDWADHVKNRLSELANKLKQFVTFDQKKNPRHKLLAHWDVETILNGTEPLGAFKYGDEIAFFENLNEFIQVIQKAMRYQANWDILTDKKADETRFLEILKANTDSNSIKNG